MKIKVIRVYNVTKNKWYSFTSLEKFNAFVNKPINYKNEFKVYTEYRKEKTYEQIKLDLKKFIPGGN